MTTPDDVWALPEGTRRPLPEVIEDRIETLIARGEIQWGAALPNENDLARSFGVGRSSVRTALQRLQHKGLVEVTRGRGWSVADRPRDSESHGGEDPDAGRDIAKLMELRAAVESAATRIAATEATDLELNAIEDAHDAHRAAAKRGVEALIKTDEDFHGAVVDAAHSPLLSEVYKLIVPHVRRLRQAGFSLNVANARQSADGHSLVLQFLRRRDSGAGAAMEMHLRTFTPAILAAAEQSATDD